MPVNALKYSGACCLSLLVLAGCKFPVTNIPAALIGAYETTQKRENWEEYAREGDVYAQYELALSYCCKPYEGATDGRKAYTWMCYAAKNGHAKAQAQMGRLYEGELRFRGVEITPNPERAYLWYYFADKRLNREGHENLARLRQAFDEKQQDALENRFKAAREMPCKTKSVSAASQ